MVMHFQQRLRPCRKKFEFQIYTIPYRGLQCQELASLLPPGRTIHNVEESFFDTRVGLFQSTLVHYNYICLGSTIASCIGIPKYRIKYTYGSMSATLQGL